MKKILLFGLLLMGIAVNAQVANPAPDITICDVGNDGIESFNLFDNNAVILGSQNPVDYTVTYSFVNNRRSSEY